MRHLSRRGFTLVELLIVIGIIVLLIAILLPALSAAREHAKRIVCMSSAKQLTTAWLMYAGANKGHFCSSETQDPNSPGTGDYGIAGIGDVLRGQPPVPKFFWSWIGDGPDHHEIAKGVLWPYLKDLQVFSCPDNPILPNTSYAINGLLAGRVGNPNPLFRFSQIKHAENVFVFIEAVKHRDDGDGDFDSDDVAVEPGRLHGGFGTPIYPGIYSQTPGQFHGLGTTNGCTITFADGHAMFWQYSDGGPSYQALDKRGRATPFPRMLGGKSDVLQLEAWSGGPVPPGVTP